MQTKERVKKAEEGARIDTVHWEAVNNSETLEDTLYDEMTSDSKNPVLSALMKEFGKKTGYDIFIQLAKDTISENITDNTIIQQTKA